MTRPAARRSAIVTGGSRGIGASVAHRLAAAGFDLTLSARGPDGLAEVADDVRRVHGVRVKVVAADMADADAVASVVPGHRAAHAGLDVLVLNAGMGMIGPLADFPVRRLEKMFAVNVRSAYQLLQAALPELREAGRSSAHGGKVIAVASMTGLVGVPNNSAYGATKAALVSFCETLNSEESTNGVTATAVCPGYVATPMTEGLSDLVSQDDMLPADDVAAVIAMLTELGRRTVVPLVPLTRPSNTIWTA